MKKIKLLPLVFAVFGLIFTACSNVDDDNNGGGGGDTGQNDGTKDKPYTVEEIISFYDANTQASKGNVWVKGYIVGGVKPGDDNNSVSSNDNVVFGSSGVRATSVLIANSTSVTDYSQCVVVELGNSAAFPADLRSRVNLADNPGNIHEELLVYGNLVRYFAIPGVRNITDYEFEGNNNNGNEEEFDIPEMSISELRELWTGSSSTVTENKKIVGVVISDLAGGNSTSLRNLTIASTDNTTGIQLRINESTHTYSMGDKIEIIVNNASLAEYGEALQLTNFSLTKTRKIGVETLTPRVISIAEFKENYIDYESTVITVTGTVTSPNGNWGGSTNQDNTVTKDGEEITAFVASYAKFKDQPVPTGEVQLTGIAGRFGDVIQIIIRNLDDVK